MTLEEARSLARSYMLGESVDVAYCLTTLMAEIERLTAENERLRAALRKIVEHALDPGGA